MKFIAQSIESYKLAGIFILAAFPLVCLPIVFEGLQHIVEVKLGMFAAGSNGLTGNAQSIRLMFGAFKVFSLIAVAICVGRFFLHGLSVSRTLQFSKSAKRSVGMALICMAATLIWVFFVGPALVKFIMPNVSAAKTMLIPLLLVLLAGLPMQNRMNGWIARVFDDTPLSDAQNKALNKTIMGNSLPVMIGALLPIMALHYFLNTQAMGAGTSVLWTLLAVDSVVVGVLACLMGASYYVVYRDGRK